MALFGMMTESIPRNNPTPPESRSRRLMTVVFESLPDLSATRNLEFEQVQTPLNHQMAISIGAFFGPFKRIRWGEILEADLGIAAQAKSAGSALDGKLIRPAQVSAGAPSDRSPPGVSAFAPEDGSSECDVCATTDSA